MMKVEKDLCKQEVYQAFYKEHARHAHNFAFYRCGDQAQSKDLIQEAFIKIWEKCSDIAFAKAKTYLFTTINNSFLNIVKHDKVVLEHEKQNPYQDKTEQSPEYLFEEQEFKQRLNRAINELTDGQREVFLLNRIDGLKYREIAERLDISQKAVEKRMTSALKKLRQSVKEI